MYICVNICIYKNTHLNIYVYTFIYVYIQNYILCVCMLYIYMYIHIHTLIYKRPPIPWNQMQKYTNCLRAAPPSRATSHPLPGPTHQQAGTSPGPLWAPQPTNSRPKSPPTCKPTSAPDPLGLTASHARTQPRQPVRWQPPHETGPDSQQGQKPALPTSVPTIDSHTTTEGPTQPIRGHP